jgi:hypothetical protein
LKTSKNLWDAKSDEILDYGTHWLQRCLVIPNAQEDGSRS